MSQPTIIGNGICIRCGGKTFISLTERFPFPEEQTQTTEESCPKCQWAIERGFSASNATTAQLHAQKQEVLRQKIEDIVTGLLAAAEVSGFSKESVNFLIIRGLPLSEIVLIYEELFRLEEEAKEGATKACSGVVQSASGSDPCMDNFYTSDLAAISIGTGQAIRRIEKVRACLKEAEAIK